MKSLLNYIKKNVAFLFGILVLAWVIFINIFPEGYIFGGGDTFQMIEARTVFIDRFFAWEGRAILFYFIFYLLDSLNIAESTQLSWYLGMFIFGSYTSFFLFTRLIFQNISRWLAVLIALFYALNLYTFFVFTGNWGYSYFPSLYIFVPVLVATLLKFFEEKKLVWAASFVLVLFLASSGFGNPAFALSFGIFTFFLIVFLYLFKFFKIKKSLGKKLFLLLVFSFLVSAFWLLPLIVKMKSGVEAITNSEHVIEFDYIIRKNSNPIFNTVSLINISENYFPNKFPNESLERFKTLFLALAFLPIFLIVIGVFQSQKLKGIDQKLFWVFLSLLFVFIMLVAKVRAPFEIINYYVYHIWGFSTLRGFDKTAIYIPFLLATLLLIVLQNFKRRKIVFGLMFLIILIPFPFYTGKIQQNIGYRLSETKNYTQTSLSFLVKIPEEYYGIRDLLNNDGEKNSIATLPISKNDGSGIVSYPTWKYYGGDLTKDLYHKKGFIEANMFRIGDLKVAEEFNNTTEKSEWIVQILGMANAGYILYHKDVNGEYVENSQWKMEELERDGLLEKLEENNYFNLYKIKSDYTTAYLSWQEKRVYINSNPEDIAAEFEIIRNSSFGAEFRKINLKKFEINWSEASMGENLILAEKFDPLWKAYSIDKSGRKKEIKTHFKARGYANGWEIENRENLDKIIIEYYPVKLMWWGIGISLISVLFLVSYLIKYYYDKKRIN